MGSPRFDDEPEKAAVFRRFPADVPRSGSCAIFTAAKAS
jgi:hypothetical protein